MSFSLILSIDENPHIFTAFRFNHLDRKQWSSIVGDFISSRRLTAPVFLFQQASEAGFDGERTRNRLNEYGLDRLPVLTGNPASVTRKSVITDLTEIIALNFLRTQCPGLRFPYPRVLHKDSPDSQHRGIDLLAYLEDDGGNFSLYIIEVMASGENNHPPQTVRDHYNQLFSNTLNQDGFSRLLNELLTIHGEAADNHDKDVLNGFIAVLLTGELNNNQDVVAVPVLVRPVDLFHPNDWKPFFDNRREFENARLPSSLWFVALELLTTFPAIYEYLRRTLSDPSLI